MTTPISQYKSVSIIVPALNEEKSLRATVQDIMNELQKNSIDGEIIIIDDGSKDNTGKIAEELSAAVGSNVKVLHHSRPMGIGCCFRDGISHADKEAITWLPGDGENDPYEIIKYLPLLQHVDIVNPFVINRGERSFLRRTLSKTYLLIVNAIFRTSFHYTNGTVLYRRSVFEKIRNISNGFFYQTECLIRAVRAGFIYAEVPILLKKRSQGRSKALSMKSTYNLFREFLKLFVEIYVQGRRAKWNIFC